MFINYIKRKVFQVFPSLPQMTPLSGQPAVIGINQAPKDKASRKTTTMTLWHNFQGKSGEKRSNR